MAPEGLIETGFVHVGKVVLQEEPGTSKVINPAAFATAFADEVAESAGDVFVE